MHLGENSFHCNQCPKTFSVSCSLKTHLRIHSGEKQFPCNQCPQTFSQEGNLKIHLQTHSDEKPFPCPQCLKAFSNGGDLKQHNHVIKPFPCNQTWSIFIRIYRLTTIIRLFGHILLYMLHWICTIHQSLNCCYIGVMPFTKNYVVTLVLCHSPKKIIVTLELCHSPKIVLLLYWSCAIH